MIGNRTTRAALLASALAAAGGIATSTPLLAQEAQQTRRFDIAAQPLAQALDAFSRASGWHLSYAPGLVRGKTSAAVQGAMTPEAALRGLVSGSGLELVQSGPGSAALVARASAAPAAADGAVVLNQITLTSADAVTEGTGAYTTGAMNTATGLAMAPRDTPQSVSVITDQQLRDQGATSVVEALRKTTGVAVIRDSGNYRFQSRGFYMDKIQEDGNNSIAPAGGINPYRSAVGLSDIGIYDRVEVVRGPTGLIQGTGEPGGTVNLMRRRPNRDGGGVASVSLGSWDKARTMLDYSAVLNPEATLRSRFIGVGQKAGSFRHGVDEWSGTLYGIVERDLGADTVLRFGGLYERRKDEPDYYGIPMGLDGTDLHLPRTTYLNTDWSKLARDKANAFAELSHGFGNGWTLDVTGNYTVYDSVSPQASLTASSGLGPEGMASIGDLYRYDNHSKQLALQARLQGEYTLLGRDHQLFAGISYLRDSFTSRLRRVLDSSSFPLRGFDGGAVPEPDWNDAGLLDRDVRYRYRYSEIGANLGTRMELSDGLHLIAGARHTRYSYDGRTHYVTYGGAPDGEVATEDLGRNRITPYLGLTYDLRPEVTLYASYTDIFKPQLQYDAQRRMLPPVTGTNIEAGVKAALLDGRVNASLALFRIVQENRAIYDTAAQASFADGKVESRGVEAEISGEVIPGWNLFAGYTWNISKYLEWEAATRPAGASFSAHTPRHMLRLHTSYELPVDGGRWTLGGGVQAQSGTESLYGIRQGGLAIWDASLRYDFDEQTSVQLVVNNLLDRRYYESNRLRTNGLNNFYGEPRNLLLTFARNF